MDVIKLRIMTEKSIIGFGKFTDLTVQNLIDMRRTPELRWIYYNCSMLSFKDNILDFLGITDEFKIDKPGKDKEKFLQIQEEKDKKTCGFDKLKRKMHNTAIEKANYVGYMKRDRIYFSKSSMQAKNQGRK